jgi:phosphatidate cytidylyltransferase
MIYAKNFQFINKKMGMLSQIVNYTKKTSELNKRVVFGIVMIAVIGLPIFFGGKIFVTMLLCLCVLVVSEYVAIIKEPKALTLLCIMSEFVAFYIMRESQFGLHKIIFLAFVIMSFDTTAYFIGKTVGRHKLCPTISPGKTIEGFLGGIAATLLLSIPIYYLLSCNVIISVYFAFVAFLAVLSQIGDIIESKFKRKYSVKDSSTLIPGHGGVLDRFDGYILTLPAFCLIDIFSMAFHITLF